MSPSEPKTGAAGTARIVAIGFAGATAVGGAASLGFVVYALLNQPMDVDPLDVNLLASVILALFPVLVLVVLAGVRRDRPRWSWAGAVPLVVVGVLPHPFWFVYLGTGVLAVLTSASLSVSDYYA